MLVDDERLIDIAFVMACAVAHLHSHEVLHRDIALRNFVLSEEDLPVLIDFGLSKKVLDLYSGCMYLKPLTYFL